MKIKLYIFGLLGVCFSCQNKSDNEALNMNEKSTEMVVDPLPFYNTADLTAEWIDPKDTRYNSIHTIAEFEFHNQNGKLITQEMLHGKIYAANFIFTRCGAICPKMTNNLKKVQEEFEKDSEVVMVSHSVMPWVDSIPRLREYANDYEMQDGKWHVLTGEREKMYELARSSYFAEKRIGLQKDSNEFLHTENVFLIDKKGRIRGVYNGTLPAEIDRLIQAIHRLKAEG